MAGTILPFFPTINTINKYFFFIPLLLFAHLFLPECVKGLVDPCQEDLWARDSSLPRPSSLAVTPAQVLALYTSLERINWIGHNKLIIIITQPTSWPVESIGDVRLCVWVFVCWCHSSKGVFIKLPIIELETQCCIIFSRQGPGPRLSGRPWQSWWSWRTWKPRWSPRSCRSWWSMKSWRPWLRGAG